MQYQCGNTYISGRRTKRELPKSTDKERVDANEAQCERDSSKSNIDAIVKMNKNMARFNHWQWQCPEKKNVDQKKLASKATEENNAEY